MALASWNFNGSIAIDDFKQLQIAELDTHKEITMEVNPCYGELNGHLSS